MSRKQLFILCSVLLAGQPVIRPDVRRHRRGDSGHQWPRVISGATVTVNEIPQTNAVREVITNRCGRVQTFHPLPPRHIHDQSGEALASKPRSRSQIELQVQQVGSSGLRAPASGR